MYLGIALTFIVLALTGRLRRTELPPVRVLSVLIGFVIIMGIDGVNSYLHFFPNAPHVYEPRNWLRLVTGMGTGVAMALFVSPALAQTLWRHQDLRPAVESLRELGSLGLLAMTTIFLVLSNQPTILYVLALTSAAGVLLIVSAIQIILLLTLLRRDGRVTKWLEAVALLSLGLLFAVIEIGAVSYVRFAFTGTMTGFPGL
jgi:hypothetical protein